MKGDEALDALVKKIFDWYMEEEPFFGTHMGLHQYDELVPDGTLDHLKKEIAQTKTFRKEVESVDPTTLSPSKRVDRNNVLHFSGLLLFELEHLRFWEQTPEGAEWMGSGLFPLFMRDFAPMPQRLGSIAARLEKFPAMLEQLKTRPTKPNKLQSEIALESAQRFPGFLMLIGQTGAEVLEGDAKTRLQEALAKANEATKAYATWIQDTVIPGAEEHVGIGEDAFRTLLEKRALGLSLEEIYDLGWTYLKESKEELARIAAKIKPGASVEEVTELVKANRPKTFPEALAYTRKSMLEARDFVRDKGLATLPEGEELKVVETPAFARHLIPFAAYSSPGRFEKVQQGLYMVTPVEDKPEMLKEHNFAGVVNTAVHEGYPGHHLQLMSANKNPSLARAMTWAVETVEGWAHYCEDMMGEQGFLTDPKVHFEQVRGQIWRACRIIIDVDLHRHKMTFDEAVDFLVKEAGLERPGALAEVKRYTSNPAYQLSYLIGKHLITQLRDDMRTRLGPKYSDRWFHDAILYAGSLPIKYMREELEQKMAALAA